MKIFRTLLSVSALSMLATLLACGGGSSSGGGGGGGTQPISVAISGTPPTSLQTGATGSFTATVTNDSASAGVTWSASCSLSSCGSFNPTKTASAAATTYTAPASATTVTITATSVTDTTKSATAQVTITAPAGPPLADGTYVFQLSGTYGLGASTTPSVYYVAGAFTVASGAITAGEQDFVDFNNVEHDAINPTGSTVTTTTDGNVQVVLTTCTGSTCGTPDTAVGVAGVETLNLSMASASTGRVIEFDTAATSSGTIDLQNATAAAAAPTGGYVFGVEGWNAGGNAVSIAGLLNVSGGAISTTGTVFDLENNGTPFQAQTITAGTVSGPDNSGRVIFGFTPTNTSFATINLAGYIVDSTRVRIVEGNDTFFGTTGGTAYAQNTTAGALAVSGNTYVAGMLGVDSNGALTGAGAFTLTSGGAVTGYISYNDLSAITPAAVLTGGTYLADSTNVGRVTLTGVTDGVHTFNIQLYVDGNGNAISMTLDTAQDVMEGVGYQQASGATFSGTYAMGATGADVTNEEELDAVGSITTGTNTFANTTGLGVDLNWISGSGGTVGVPSTNLTVAGAFSATSNQISSGAGNTLKGLDVTTATNADAFDYYVANPSTVIGIEVDGNQITLIYFVQ